MFTQLERFFSIVNVGEEGDVKSRCTNNNRLVIYSLLYYKPRTAYRPAKENFSYRL